jgi:hypothetical protein
MEIVTHQKEARKLFVTSSSKGWTISFENGMQLSGCYSAESEAIKMAEAFAHMLKAEVVVRTPQGSYFG